MTRKKYTKDVNPNITDDINNIKEKKLQKIFITDFNKVYEKNQPWSVIHFDQLINMYEYIKSFIFINNKLRFHNFIDFMENQSSIPDNNIIMWIYENQPVLFTQYENLKKNDLFLKRKCSFEDYASLCHTYTW